MEREEREDSKEGWGVHVYMLTFLFLTIFLSRNPSETLPSFQFDSSSLEEVLYRRAVTDITYIHTYIHTYIYTYIPLLEKKVVSVS